MNEITIGEAIRLWRNRRGLSQGGLANRADVSRNSISMLERGTYYNPSLMQLEKIANAMGLQLEIRFIPLDE